MFKTISIALLTLGLAAGTALAKPKGKKPADLAQGKKIFETNCATCHGMNGKGDGPAAAALPKQPRNFTDTAYMKTRTRAQLTKVITEGGAANGFSPLMASWKGTLKPAEIHAVLDYVLTFSGQEDKK